MACRGRAARHDFSQTHGSAHGRTPLNPTVRRTLFDSERDMNGARLRLTISLFCLAHALGCSRSGSRENATSALPGAELTATSVVFALNHIEERLSPDSGLFLWLDPNATGAIRLPEGIGAAVREAGYHVVPAIRGRTFPSQSIIFRIDSLQHGESEVVTFGQAVQFRQYPVGTMYDIQLAYPCLDLTCRPHRSSEIVSASDVEHSSR